MNCEQAREQLSAYLDDMLGPRESQLLKEHLASCPSCAADLSRLQACVGHLHALPAVRAPEGFARRVQERIRRRSEFSSIVRTLFVPFKVKVPLEAAGVLVTVLVAVVVMRNSDLRRAMDMRPQPQAVREAPAPVRAPAADRGPIALTREKPAGLPEPAAQLADQGPAHKPEAVPAEAVPVREEQSVAEKSAVREPTAFFDARTQQGALRMTRTLRKVATAPLTISLTAAGELEEMAELVFLEADKAGGTISAVDELDGPPAKQIWLSLPAAAYQGFLRGVTAALGLSSDGLPVLKTRAESVDIRLLLRRKPAQEQAPAPEEQPQER